MRMESSTVNLLSSTPTLSLENPTQFSRPVTVLAAVAACIFTVVGVVGNLFTVVALIKCAKLRTHATTTFVISLAASDLLFSSINLPLTACRYIHEEWLLGDTLCRLYPVLFYGNVGVSLMNMVAITLNRYVLISCPGTYPKIYSRMNILLMVAGVWIFSFGLLLPPLLEIWGTLGLDPPTFSCTVLKDSEGRSPKKFLFLFGFLLPCVAIIVCYSAIFYRVRQSRLNVQKHIGLEGRRNKESALQSSQKKEDLRMTKMMLIIFLSFLICFLPLMLVNVIDDEMAVPTLHVVASVLAWMSSVINPFIYAFKNRQYKQAFKKLLCVYQRVDQPVSRPGASQASGQSKQSASKTFITEMLQYNAGQEKIKMVSQQKGRSMAENE
ncbi:protein trapped in endoderm-1 [Eurytemora carolleeae]|uniref:protein trapped in endoderm-1 n=1 Tax=Eurytemora carolleeae TaxID=1294199 RepID=UPI000C765542|nr:protein trapped in endoderm-1 [Eurytemora carolleeae]|eukprot:XP_023333494.1 protein trapped in endoderm-1-like [Eurytemora affinis]